MSSRAFRDTAYNYESASSLKPEAVPFLTQERRAEHQDSHLDLELGDCEAAPTSGYHSSNSDYDTHSNGNSAPLLDHVPVYAHPEAAKRWTLRSLRSLFGRRRRLSLRKLVLEKDSVLPRPRPSVFRKILCLLAIALMLLGLVQSILLVCGILVAFFPDEFDSAHDQWRALDRPDGIGHWPTDITADIHPVTCHSHNDYWRKEPLFSAIKAGCTGVEADVWLFEEELFVGHNTASLTPSRTLQTLYVDPLLKLLDQMNPIHSLHPTLDRPRHGIFDTDPFRTLILLIDFKTNGEEIWPYVHLQLEPLRQKKYLTYFNGSQVVDGPITVVATGNAPFNKVVANSNYRDIFFDAPLDLMSAVPLSEPAPPSGSDVFDTKIHLDERSLDQGQGHSGAAPKDPSTYTRSNSYYASVSFKQSIGFPWRSGHLSEGQIDLIRKQIAGAHAQGLKVRYWAVPSWPRGMRNYLWRTLVKEGVDFLSVDDLKAATDSDWTRPPRRGGWFGSWSLWS